MLAGNYKQNKKGLKSELSCTTDGQRCNCMNLTHNTEFNLQTG